MDLKEKIRTIPDFPEPGILFRDITTLLSDAEALNETIERFEQHFKDEKIDLVAGVESRGFILGAPLAIKMGLGFIPIRKAGKLPGPTHGMDYELEYGKDRVEVHQDAIKKGNRVLMVDDLIATGGTIQASSKLVKKIGATIVGYAFVIELIDLKGKDLLEEPVFSLIEFEGH